MSNLNKDILWTEIESVSKLSGSFKLRSGLHSDTYFDKYQFETHPRLVKQIAERMKRLIPNDTEILGGLELGGVPLATALSIETGLPSVFVRKEAKEYGTCKLAEGPPILGKRICLIEDIISTGGQVAASAKQLRKQGAIVDHVICVIWRGSSESNPLLTDGIEMLPVFKPEVGL